MPGKPLRRIRSHDWNVVASVRADTYRPRRAGRASPAAHASTNNQKVDQAIHHDAHNAEHRLQRLGQAVRVDDRQQITQYEIPLVRSPARHRAQIIFQGRQRARPVQDLDQRTPYRGGHVPPRDACPAQDQQSAADDYDKKHKKNKKHKNNKKQKHLGLRSGLREASVCHLRYEFSTPGMRKSHKKRSFDLSVGIRGSRSPMSKFPREFSSVIRKTIWWQLAATLAGADGEPLRFANRSPLYLLTLGVARRDSHPYRRNRRRNF